MSAATQLTTDLPVGSLPSALPGVQPIPVPWRHAPLRPGHAAAEADAVVITLHRPSAQSVAPPVRLTRRGVQVLVVAVAVLAVSLVWLARLSAVAAGPAPAAAPAVVTVHTGDTLWSIANRIAPDRDPGAEIAALEALNHLSSVAIVPGQVLRTR